MRRKRLAVHALGLVTALIVLVAPAHASQMKLVCVFNGEAKAWDKTEPPPIRVIGGNGTFSVGNLQAVCVGTAKGTPAAQILTITAEGVYSSRICGTGKVIGTITSVAGPLKYQAILKGRKFAAHFLSAAGLFFWHSWAKTTIPDLKDDALDEVTEHPDSKPSPDKAWQLAGSMGIAPATGKEPLSIPGVPPGNCFKAFSFDGVVLVDENV